MDVLKAEAKEIKDLLYDDCTSKNCSRCWDYLGTDTVGRNICMKAVKILQDQRDIDRGITP